jgi:predicted nuclease with RNAse H fold
MKNKIKYFVGIDVQISRGCAYYILDSEKKFVTSGWIKKNVSASFKKLFGELTDNQGDIIAIGIDAPRMPLKKLRTRYFEKKKNEWNVKPQKSNGRECEVIVKSYNLANPQWTRTYKELPDWMRLGYDIFSQLKNFSFVYEVFPSASYKMLENENVKYELCLNEFNSGVKDMLDASVAALTVFEFVNGQGCEVGGDDGLGTIVLPRKILL